MHELRFRGSFFIIVARAEAGGRNPGAYALPGVSEGKKAALGYLNDKKQVLPMPDDSGRLRR
jgi:hypothetical protein